MGVPRRCRDVVVCCAAALSLMPAGDALATGGIGFTVDDPIALEASGGPQRAPIELCNTGSASAAYELRLAGFASASQASPSSVTKGGTSLAIQAPVGSVDPGGCVGTTLTLDPGTSPTALSGDVVLVAVGSEIARRSVTVSMPANPTTITELKISGHFSAPFGVRGDVDLDGDAILLGYDGATPTIPAGRRIGVVAAGDDEAEVWTTSASSPAGDGVLRVPIELRHASGAGTFSGQLDTTSIGSADEPVSITFVVRDRATVAVLVFLAGLLLSLAARWVSGALLPRKRLATWRDRVGPRYTRNFAIFKGLSSHAAGFAPPDATDIAAFVDDNRRATQRYAATTVLFDVANDGLKAIRQQISAADADADRLVDTGPEGLATHLTTLADRIDGLEELVDTWFGGLTPEQLLADASAALGSAAAPTKIPIGGVTELIAQIDKRVEALDVWEAMAGRIRRLLIWHLRLTENITDDAAPALAEAHIRLVEAIQLLCDAPHADQAELASARLAVDRAQRMLSYLGARFGVRPPSRWDEKIDEQVELFEQVDIRLAATPHAGTAAIHIIGSLIEPDRPPSRMTVIFLELFTLAVTAGFALFVTARLLIVDKPFGTAGDYLAMLGAGIGADVLTTGILAAFANWRVPAPTPATTAKA